MHADQALFVLSEYEGIHAQGLEVYNGTDDQEYCPKLLGAETALPGPNGKPPVA